MIRPDGWAEVFGELPRTLAATAGKLDDLVRRTAPAAVTVAYPGYRSMSYGVGPRKNSEGAAYIAAHSRRVNLGFYRGVSLDDPEGILEGTGAALRHVKLSAADFDAAPLEALVAVAFAERRAALGRT
ncbi:MAG TPA: hypothetical protein DIU07_09885 [Rhodobacteraceae bacterium]|nr:hypothetical protein [Paracoccaceae bacterium]